MMRISSQLGQPTKHLTVRLPDDRPFLVTLFIGAQLNWIRSGRQGSLIYDLPAFEQTS